MSAPIRYINIAMVGHVSNGKTTLVGALTSVNTKKNSEEKSSGRTIKLGYANCILWKCSACGTFTSTGQKDKTSLCPSCAESMSVAHYISFVDAPGHHQYIQTMARGAAVIDGAILVTDSNQNHIQVQTKEHLAILSILNVDNVIVVQNKIDLIDSDTCLKHHDLLRDYLKGTSAENAPIIPLAAQSKLLIENIYPYLNEICNVAKTKPITYPKVFSVIRSFDINRPNTGATDLKGGILGGSMLGVSALSVGDMIEIRPSPVKNSSIPLTTVITSIFSETDRVDSITTGGLYGLGTKLDPTLTKVDGLIGTLCGKPEDLPPAITSVILDVKHIKLDESVTQEKIKVGTVYRLMSGNTVAQAIARKTAVKGQFEFIMNRPI